VLYSAVAKQKAIDVADIVMEWNSEVVKDASDRPHGIGKHRFTSPI
jgi:heme oxygenase